jgi:uncharacterized protein YndB with AHSA1/START domain
MHDLIAELHRTSRAVGATEANGAAAHVVELRRELSAPVSDVWNACTDPERVPRWFLPLSGDLRLGGTFQLEGNAGGTVVACEPPHRLELTWQVGDAQPSLVSLALTEVDAGGTELVLRHTVPDDEHWAQYGPGAVGVGWELGLIALAQHVGGEDPDSSQFGPAILRESAAAWGAAHEAAGTSPEAARAAAARTSNFYAPDH